MKRAHRQLIIWQQAPFSLIEEKDPLEFRCEKENDVWMQKSSDGLVAPERVVELISCGCRGTCQKDYCRIQTEGQNCTDFCGCSDLCENMDPVPNIQSSTSEDEGSGE